MSTTQEELTGLLALAHDRADESRLKLAEKLSNLFLREDTALTDREERLVNDLIDLLLKSSSMMVRQDLITRLASATRMPRSMSVQLAQKEVDVARVILKGNELLHDDDLVSIIATQSRDHAAAIAERRSISEAVADALVITGDLNVMQIVAANLGAQLSMKALHILADACRLSHGLHEPLIRRPELTPDIASKLYWTIATDLRRYTMQRFGLALGQVDLALGKAIEDKLSERRLQQNDDEVMGAVATWIEERTPITSKILLQILRLEHFRLFNIVMSRLSGLSLPLVDIIVGETGGRMLAALCRAVNIEKPNFVSIFLLSRGARKDEQIVHPREMSYALAAYDMLTHEMAQDLLYNWRQNPDYITKHDTVQLV